MPQARACTECTSNASRSSLKGRVPDGDDAPGRGRPRHRCRQRGGTGCAARSAARPDRPTTIATPGSSASPRRSSPASGSASTSPSGLVRAASGARVALPIWSDFMRRVSRYRAAQPFAPPPDLHGEELCLLSYQRPVEGCPTYVEYFKDGDRFPCDSARSTPGRSSRRPVARSRGSSLPSARD